VGDKILIVIKISSLDPPYHILAIIFSPHNPTLILYKLSICWEL